MVFSCVVSVRRGQSLVCVSTCKHRASKASAQGTEVFLAVSSRAAGLHKNKEALSQNCWCESKPGHSSGSGWER